MARRISPYLIVTLSLFASCRPAGENADENVLPQNTIEIRDAWVRPAARGMTGGAYMTILNGKETNDTLAGISSDAAVMTEVHETYETGGGMTGMRPAENLTVEAGSTLRLSPGSYHIMLMQLNRDLVPGDSITVTLNFARNGPLLFRIPVMEQSPMRE